MNIKKSIAHILDNDENVKQYIASLERDIDNSKKIDKTVELILENILNSYQNFTDRKHLSAKNIDAVTNLLKLQSELPMKRIQTKKLILDMLTKKIELEIKNKSANATNTLATTTGDFLKAVFLRLDQNKIHPKLDSVQMLALECDDIIDIPIVEIPKEPEKKLNIAEIQMQLDNQEEGS